MTKSYILAMDIAQQSAVVQLSRADGTKLWRGTLPTDLTGWQRLEQLLVEHQVRSSELLVIAEATRHLSFGLGRTADQIGCARVRA